jgi:hypothetical protein
MRSITTPSSLARVAVPVFALVVVTSCATGTPAASPAPGAGAGSPSVSSPSTVSGPSASCAGGTWRHVPVGVSRHVAAPAMPVVTDVRTAAHPECGYDRLVLDITGPLPSYEVSSVTQVTADPSGKPITLPGRRYLLITLQPARAHDSSGGSTVSRSAQTLGYPVLKGYALAGDFEGVFTLALGLDGPASIRIGELPGHWYIDVKA